MLAAKAQLLISHSLRSYIAIYKSWCYVSYDTSFFSRKQQTSYPYILRTKKSISKKSRDCWIYVYINAEQRRRRITAVSKSKAIHTVFVLVVGHRSSLSHSTSRQVSHVLHHEKKERNKNEKESERPGENYSRMSIATGGGKARPLVVAGGRDMRSLTHSRRRPTSAISDISLSRPVASDSFPKLFQPNRR